MTWSKDVLLPLVMIVAAGALSFSAAKYWARKQAALLLSTTRLEADQKMRDRITELERQLAVIGQTVQPISTAFQALLIKQLTHFHTPELDALLVKLGPPYGLSPDEETRIAELLDQRTRDMGELIDDSERDAAHMLPYVIRRVRTESALDSLDLKVVAVPKEEDG